MENKFKNELALKIGGVEILLRPTFENMAKMETEMGGLAYLAYKYGQGINSVTGQIEPDKAAKAMPPMTECAKIIYFNQVGTSYSLDEIFDLVMQEGLGISGQIMIFLVRCTAGNKFQSEVSEAQKKS